MAYGNGGGIGTVGSYGEASRPSAAQREGAIASQMAMLEKHSEHLHQTIAELEARIGSVLMPEPPPAIQKDAAVGPTPGVPLGASLADMNTRIAHATMRLRSLIERVGL